MSQVKRTKVDDVLVFMKQFDRAPKVKRASPQPIIEAPLELKGVQVQSSKTTEAKLEAFRAELERLEPYFKPGKRQNTIMGVSAYGVRALGLPDEIVRRENEAFLHATDNDELPERLEAIERTLQKHRSGELVAWNHYYNLAGIPLPVRIPSDPPPKVLALIEQTRMLLDQGIWQPRTGTTDRAIFAALLTYATHFGRDHESGFSVCVSTRDIALKAGRSHPTTLRALRRLVGQGLIRREGWQRYGDAGVLVVLMHKVTKLYHSSGTWGGLKECLKLYTHPAFRHACLNKSAIDPLAVLINSDEALTRSEIGKRVGKKSRALTKPLAKLLEHDLIVEQDRRYQVVNDWEAALDCAAMKTGALAAEQRDKNLYEVQRDEFKRRLARNRNQENSVDGATISGEVLAC